MKKVTALEFIRAICIEFNHRMDSKRHWPKEEVKNELARSVLAISLKIRKDVENEN